MPKRKMKLTPEKRVELVESYLNGEDSMTSLARTAGISWAALSNWVMLYENEGLLSHREQEVVKRVF
ncbi:transposase [Enterococcus hirae]|uniref:transposase n=1 Tax=Enterococcus hirae TaxID=1354 RepID=UPI00136A91B5|nr:transposase [Enterococcus hirae]NAD86940.1 transposase [Enterococcus hirae]